MECSRGAFSTYTVYVPTGANDTRSHDELREELLAKHPYAELPTYSLPNGLIVDFQSEGEKLVSISQIVDGDSKENSKTIEGYIGIRYDGKWTLVKPVAKNRG